MGTQSQGTYTSKADAPVSIAKTMKQDKVGVHISLIIPVYNAKEFIADNIRQAALYLKGQGGVNELILVDDASTDSTYEILKSLAPELAGISCILLRNDQNQGKGFSVRRGMSVAKGKYLIFNDADFTYPVEQIGVMASHLERGEEVVIGCRVHPDSRYEIGPEFFSYFMTRHLMSRIFNILVNLFLGLKIRDTQAGIKGFSRKAAKTIFSHLRLNRFSFDLEMLYIAREKNLNIREVPIRFLYRKEPTTVKFVRDSLQILLDIAKIKWRGLTGVYKKN